MHGTILLYLTFLSRHAAHAVAYRLRVFFITTSFSKGSSRSDALVSNIPTAIRRTVQPFDKQG